MEKKKRMKDKQPIIFEHSAKYFRAKSKLFKEIYRKRKEKERRFVVILFIVTILFIAVGERFEGTFRKNFAKSSHHVMIK